MYDATPSRQAVQDSCVTSPSEIWILMKWVFQASFTDRKYYELCVSIFRHFWVKSLDATATCERAWGPEMQLGENLVVVYGRDESAFHL